MARAVKSVDQAFCTKHEEQFLLGSDLQRSTPKSNSVISSQLPASGSDGAELVLWLALQGCKCAHSVL